MKITQNEIALIKQGISINKIRALTGFNKSTIYYHYKRLFGKKIPQVDICFKSDTELGEFLGIFAGDGSFFKNPKTYHYTISIAIGHYEKGYIRHLKQKLPEWFNKKPYIFYQKHNGKASCIIFIYRSKKIYDTIRNYLEWNGKKTYSIRLRGLDLKKREFNRGFVRGLVDTDGNFYSPKRRLSISSVSEKLIDQIEEILIHNCSLFPKRFCYKKKNRAMLYTVALNGENAKKFIEVIKPSNPLKCGSGVVWHHTSFPKKGDSLEPEFKSRLPHNAL